MKLQSKVKLNFNCCDKSSCFSMYYNIPFPRLQYFLWFLQCLEHVQTKNHVSIANGKLLILIGEAKPFLLRE